ncbi:PKD domain-containing protein [Methanoregula sp.]|uniref:PKD domain-containing protein n=1 Tax=Methanoregula sp. TaxID=2052170 RepID=UPI0035631738
MKSDSLIILCIIVLFLAFFEMPVVGADEIVKTAIPMNATPVLILHDMNIGSPIANVTGWDNKTLIDTSTAFKGNNSLNIPVHGKEKILISDTANGVKPEVAKSAIDLSPVPTKAKQKIHENRTTNHSVSKRGLVYRSNNGIREVLDRRGNKIFSTEDFKNKSIIIPATHSKTIRNTKQYGTNLSERAINGQFDQVTETYEQEILNEQQGIWWPPIPDGWTFTSENGPEMYWEPDDWEADYSDYHATVIFCHTGDRGTMQTTLDATGGQYVRVTMGLGYYDSEPIEVYLDNILLGNITACDSTVQFDISDRSWTTASTLKIVAAGNQWTNNLVRSISLMAEDTIELPVAEFNGTPRSGNMPLDIIFTDASQGDPLTWFWSFGDGGTSTLQNPTHTYSNAGNYTVSLTVTNAGGNNTMTKVGYVVVTALISNQATDIAGRLMHQSDIEDAASKQQLMNYNPTTFYNADPITIKSRLPNDQIFFFSGHGNLGEIQLNDSFFDPGQTLFYAKNNTNSFDEASTSYSNMKLAVFFGCHTGNTSADHGNLVDVVISKSAGCAMGWTELIAADGMHSYSSAFWSALQNGKTIQQAHEDGKNAATEDSYCKSLEGPIDNPDKYQYCLFEHLYSQGSSCSQSLPTGAVNQMIQRLKLDQSEQESSPASESLLGKSTLLKEQQSIRKFSSDNDSKGPVYQKTTHYSYGYLDTFTADNVTYNVNRNTGRIQSQYTNVIEPSTGNNIISINQGLLIADSYAKEKCPEFWENETNKVIKKISQIAKDSGFVYSWRQYFVLPNESLTDSKEIAGFNQIDVTLDAHDGKVKSYHEWYIPRDANLNLNPDQSEEQAWEKVKKYLEDTGIRAIGVTQRKNLGLVIAIDDNNIQHLAWQFEIKQDMMNPNFYGGQIIVDAHNGQIVRYIKFG